MSAPHRPRQQQRSNWVGQLSAGSVQALAWRAAQRWQLPCLSRALCTACAVCAPLRPWVPVRRWGASRETDLAHWNKLHFGPTLRGEAMQFNGRAPSLASAPCVYLRLKEQVGGRCAGHAVCLLFASFWRTPCRACTHGHTLVRWPPWHAVFREREERLRAHHSRPLLRQPEQADRRAHRCVGEAARTHCAALSKPARARLTRERRTRCRLLLRSKLNALPAA